jgi:hypothetical protein
MKLFLDDIRVPKDDSWVIARSVADAIAIISACDSFDEATLDHDLGLLSCMGCTSWKCPADDKCDCHCHSEAPTGLKLLYWMAENDKWPKKKPSVHSMNPVGRKNMEDFIDRYYPGEK